MTRDYPMTRDEHLAWAKGRALAYLDAGDLINAVASMGSDLSQHEAFQKPPYQTLVALGIVDASQGDPNRVRRWIEGFN